MREMIAVLASIHKEWFYHFRSLEYYPAVLKLEDKGVSIIDKVLVNGTYLLVALMVNGMELLGIKMVK